MRTAALKNNARRTVITITKKITKGKKFEDIFKDSIKLVQDVSIDRIHDQTTKYKGSKNVSDFIAYKYPRQYYFECKTTSCTSLSFDNITQWQDLLEKSRIHGVVAGVVIWFYAKDVTIFVDIRLLECMRQEGYKSIAWDCHWLVDDRIAKWSDYWCRIDGKKKLVYFDYDMDKFFKSLDIIYGGEFDECL